MIKELNKNIIIKTINGFLISYTYCSKLHDID